MHAHAHVHTHAHAHTHTSNVETGNNLREGQLVYLLSQALGDLY